MQKRRQLKPEERRSIYDKMGGHCAYCGCELHYKDMQVDHVVPLRKGGPDVLDNMLPACRSCNHYKDSMDLEGFRELVEKMPHTLARDSVTYRNAVRFGMVEPKPHHVVFYFEKEEPTDIKWLSWENAEEWGTIYCPMLDAEVMTYCPKGAPAFDTYTAPFVDADGEVCYYKYDQDEGAWDEDLLFVSEYKEGMKLRLC